MPDDRVYMFKVTPLHSVTGRMEISNIDLLVLNKNLQEVTNIQAMHIPDVAIYDTKRFMVQQVKDWKVSSTINI